MLESKFQASLIRDIKEMFPGCFVLKNDANYMQGIPDLIILFKDKYAVLEVKKSKDAKHRPNQDYYIEKFGKWVYSSFVSPETKKEVLDGLHSAFES